MLTLSSKGLLVVLSGPSGVGKGTVCSFLRNEYPDLSYSISATTRMPRQGEIDGVNYYFLNREEFVAQREKGNFLEWAEVYGNFYGTPRQAVEEKLERGINVLLEIDIQGALKVKKAFPEGVLIFLLPPSKAELQKRILGRATDSAEVIAGRLACVDEELSYLDQYQYAVVNERVEEAAHQIASIIIAEKCRVSRNIDRLNFKEGSNFE